MSDRKLDWTRGRIGQRWLQKCVEDVGSSKLLMNRIDEFTSGNQRGEGDILEVSEQVVPPRERVCDGPQKSPHLIT